MIRTIFNVGGHPPHPPFLYIFIFSFNIQGMLAHEMAHSIIDHYLTVRPPKRSAEILARFVDKHLAE